MSITRKIKREKEIQARKAVRQELKTQAVVDFVKGEYLKGKRDGFRNGCLAMREAITEAAFHLEYE